MAFVLFLIPKSGLITAETKARAETKACPRTYKMATDKALHVEMGQQKEVVRVLA